MSLFEDEDEHNNTHSSGKSVTYDFDLDELDMTTDEINWDEMSGKF